MPRFYPDEQPDAVSPVFSRAGVERLVPPRYDDSPDSPNFYAPRIPQMMQSPGMPMQQRPWDDGPDSPNFYGARIPQAMQPPGIQRPWDDGPDTDNFHRPSSRNQLEMGRSVFQPWEEQPDAPNFSSQRMVEARQVPRFKPWDDGPDTDNFYRPDSSSLQEMPAVTTRPWDDGPDTDNFCTRFSVNLPGYPVQQGMDEYLQPDYVPKSQIHMVPLVQQRHNDNPDVVSIDFTRTQFLSGVLRVRDELSGAMNSQQMIAKNKTPSYSTTKQGFSASCSFKFEPLDKRTNFEAHPIPHFYEDPYPSEKGRY